MLLPGPARCAQENRPSITHSSRPRRAWGSRSQRAAALQRHKMRSSVGTHAACGKQRGRRGEKGRGRWRRDKLQNAKRGSHPAQPSPALQAGRAFLDVQWSWLACMHACIVLPCTHACTILASTHACMHGPGEFRRGHKAGFPPTAESQLSSPASGLTSAARALISPFRVLSGVRAGRPRLPGLPACASDRSSDSRSQM